MSIFSGEVHLCCFKVAEDEYDIFKQVIIFGIRRELYATPDKVKMSPILAWAEGNQIASCEEIEVEVEKASAEGGIKRVKVKESRPVFASLDFLQYGLGEYQIPISPESPFRFRYTPFTSEELYREAASAASRLNTSGRWLSFRPKLEPTVYRPAMSPKRGHISQQLLGGLLGTNTVHKPDGTLLMLKGQINKISNTKILDDDDLPSDPDKEKMTRVEVVESFQTIITTLDNEGDLQTLVKVEEIGALLDQYVEQLAEILQMRNKPRYDFHPQPWEWDVFNTLSRGRLLSGRSETGLTDTQKHLAIALGRLLLEVGAGFFNAEMGSGKTTISIAIAEYLKVAVERRNGKKSPYPAMVVGPGIVTGKENWPKEIPEVTPGATSKVVTIGVKPVAKTLKLGQWLKLMGLIIEEWRFSGLDPKTALSLIMRAAYKQGISLDNWINAIRYTLQQAEKRPSIRRKGESCPNPLDRRIGGFLWTGMGLPRDEENCLELKGKYSLPQFITDYKSGRMIFPRFSRHD